MQEEREMNREECEGRDDEARMVTLRNASKKKKKKKRREGKRAVSNIFHYSEVTKCKLFKVPL